MHFYKSVVDNYNILLENVVEKKSLFIRAITCRRNMELHLPKEKCVKSSERKSQISTVTYHSGTNHPTTE